MSTDVHRDLYPRTALPHARGAEERSGGRAAPRPATGGPVEWSATCSSSKAIESLVKDAVALSEEAFSVGQEL